MERDDKRTINWLVRWLSVIWLAGTGLGALRLFAAIFEKYPILGSLLSCGWVIAAVLAICHVFDQTRNESSDAEGTNQNSETENGASLSAANAVKPIVKAVVKAKAVAPYQTKMCGLAKQFEDYDAELRNLGKETGNYKKVMEIIKKEFNRQCDYVARIAEIEGKQGDMSGNEKTVEISKKVRKSYKAHRDEATKSIESLIGNAEQVVVLMQRDLQNQIFDAHAQVETGKINDMISKLEGSVQLDKEINAEAAESCMELKGIEQPSKEQNEPAARRASSPTTAVATRRRAGNG